MVESVAAASPFELEDAASESRGGQLTVTVATGIRLIITGIMASCVRHTCTPRRAGRGLGIATGTRVGRAGRLARWPPQAPASCIAMSRCAESDSDSESGIVISGSIRYYLAASGIRNQARPRMGVDYQPEAPSLISLI